MRGGRSSRKVPRGRSPRLIHSTRKSDDGRHARIEWNDGFSYLFESRSLRELAKSLVDADDLGEEPPRAGEFVR